MKPLLRRRWLWLFAALLPGTLYAAPAERNSSPLTIKDSIFGNREILSFAWSPDSQIVAIHTAKSFVIVNAQAGRIIRRIKFPTVKPSLSASSIYFEFSSNGKWLRMKSGSLHIPDGKWSVPEKEFLRARHAPWESLAGITKFGSPNGKLWAVTSLEDCLHPGWEGDAGRTYPVILGLDLFDSRSKKLISHLWGRPEAGGYILDCGFLGNGELFFAQLASRWPQPAIYIWRTNGGKEILNLDLQKLESQTQLPPDRYTAIDIAPDGTLVAAWAHSLLRQNSYKGLWLFDVHLQKVIRHIGNPDEITFARFSPDGRTLAVGGKHGTLTLYRIK